MIQKHLFIHKKKLFSSYSQRDVLSQILSQVLGGIDKILSVLSALPVMGSGFRDAEVEGILLRANFSSAFLPSEAVLHCYFVESVALFQLWSRLSSMDLNHPGSSKTSSFGISWVSWAESRGGVKAGKACRKLGIHHHTIGTDNWDIDLKSGDSN